MVSLIQLEYIVTLANTGQFSQAAEKCFVTQPTLSMQIKKMESDLGVIIFDRSKQPVVPTEIGLTIIEQAKIILAESKKIDEIIKDSKNEISGDIKIGIIPSVAPYLLPLFIGEFARKYPELNISVSELMTSEILEALAKDEIDLGILATPLKVSGTKERVLFYEKILLYCNENHELSTASSVDANKIKNEHVWLLSDGHCFRNHAINLCSLDKKENKLNFSYESASIETLIKLVDKEGGMTLIPELAKNQLKNQNLAKAIKNNPVREISLITNRIFIKKSILEALQESIVNSLPKELLENKEGEIVEWQ